MEELYARIEDYLDGALTAAERVAFEAELQADPALAEALQQVRETRERLAMQWTQESKEAELRKTLKELGKQHFSGGGSANEVARRIPLVRWWMAAAVLTAIAIWIFWPAGENALYDRYRQFPEAAFTEKSGGAPTLSEAGQLFNDENYAAALTILTAHLEQQPADLEARFFAGLCQLETGRLTAAESAFRQILSNENAWSQEARWYLALTFLKGKKTPECKETLNRIQPGEAYYEEAQQLLKKL